MGGPGVVAEGEVDDVGAVVGGPADAVREGVATGVAGLGAGRVLVLQDDADGQDLRLRGDSHDAVGVTRSVAVPGDDARHGGAVPGPGHVAAVRAETDQVLVPEHIALEIRVQGVDAGVEDGDGDALALGRAPRLLRVHRVEAPLLGAYAVGVRGGRGHQREGGGEQGGEGAALREIRGPRASGAGRGRRARPTGASYRSYRRDRSCGTAGCGRRGRRGGS